MSSQGQKVRQVMSTRPIYGAWLNYILVLVSYSLSSSSVSRATEENYSEVAFAVHSPFRGKMIFFLLITDQQRHDKFEWQEEKKRQREEGTEKWHVNQAKFPFNMVRQILDWWKVRNIWTQFGYMRNINAILPVSLCFHYLLECARTSVPNIVIVVLLLIGRKN